MQWNEHIAFRVNRYETLHLNENWNKKTRNRIENYFHTNKPFELDKKEKQIQRTHRAHVRMPPSPPPHVSKQHHSYFWLEYSSFINKRLFFFSFYFGRTLCTVYFCSDNMKTMVYREIKSSSISHFRVIVPHRRSIINVSKCIRIITIPWARAINEYTIYIFRCRCWCRAKQAKIFTLHSAHVFLPSSSIFILVRHNLMLFNSHFSISTLRQKKWEK